MVKGETGESKEKSEKTIGRNFKNRVELSFSFFFFFLLFFWLVWTGISLYPVYTVITIFPGISSRFFSKRESLKYASLSSFNDR